MPTFVGFGVVEADYETEVRERAADDPAVLKGLGEIEVGTLLTGFVRAPTS